MGLKKLNRTTFFIGSIISTIVVSILISSIFSVFNDKPIQSEIVRNYSIIKRLILVVIVAPFFETLFFQAAVIEFFLYHLNIKNAIIPIIISGLIFGSLHYMNNYNLIYMFAAILMGFLFASIYVIAKKRRDNNPLIITFICHFSTNLVALLTESA